MTQKELKKALEEPTSLFKMYEKIKELENSPKIDWSAKSNNPSLSNLQAFNIFKNGLSDMIVERKQKIKDGFRFINLSVGERLAITNCYKAFGKYIDWNNDTTN